MGAPALNLKEIMSCIEDLLNFILRNCGIYVTIYSMTSEAFRGEYYLV